MSMTEKEVKHYWNYFCSLCRRLENTRQYVDHTSENNELKNANVNSFEFQQIILLASMEFENLSKALCLEIDSSFNLQNANIKKISETILLKYPHIIDTEVSTDYQILKPLKDWNVNVDPATGKKYVAGISWWDDYSNIKHQSFWKFHLATLGNAVNALASLMVLELYLMKSVLNSVNMSLSIECDYFSNEYASALLCSGEKALPDFNGATTRDLVQDGSLILNTI